MTRLQQQRVMGVTLILYIVAYVVQLLFPIGMHYVDAETPVSDTKLVAVFVDEALYQDNQINDDIQRYAKDYIQQRMGSTKALILPLDTEQIKAQDIVRILENLYFEGEKDVASTLEGAVFVGDRIPLPVVNDDGYIFPTIFPYVDFIDQRYLWNKQTTYFEPNNNDQSEPEIWHGLIFLGEEEQSYHEYFQKLRRYVAQGPDYIGKNIWYDDFKAYAETFNTDFLPYYINKFIFAEDINYKRFTQRLFDLFNADHNASIQDLLDNPIAVQSGSFYAQSAQQFNNNLSGGAQAGAVASQIQDVPAKMIETSLTNFFREYKDLLGSSYLQTMRDNIIAGGRYLVSDIDTHSDFVQLQDSLYASSPGSNALLMQYNKRLQDEIIQQVDNQKYAVRVPLLVFYREEKNQITNDDNNLSCWKDWYYLEGEYENFYFGKNAWDITGAQDLSIFKGRYLNAPNLTALDAYDWTNSGQYDYLATKSVGGSYAVLDQQIEANRGYNFFLTERDIQDAQVQIDNKNITACEDQQDYIAGYWGGNTPINLGTGPNNELSLQSSDFSIAWNPSFDRSIGGWLYDMAGARKVSTEQAAAYDRTALNAFANVQRIQRETDGEVFLDLSPSNVASLLLNIQPPTPGEKVLQACDVNARKVGDYQDMDYFAVMSGMMTTPASGLFKNIQLVTGNKIPNIPLPQNPIVIAETTQEQRCGIVNQFATNIGGEYKAKQFYQYKTIDSVVINDAPNPAQFNAMNQFTTLDAPVDSIRHMTFKGVHGETIRFDFPNLYHVPVYKESNNQLVLMTPQEIEQSLDAYLTGLVADYNNKLLAALTQRTAHYQQYTGAYDLLGQADPYATVNRGYTLLDENVLRDLLPPQLKKEFAQILAIQNAPWPKRNIPQTVTQDIQEVKQTADLNLKIKSIIQSYLRYVQTPDIFAQVGYKQDGYEVAYINSDGNDYFQLDGAPEFILTLLRQQSRIMSQMDQAQQDTRGDDELTCGVQPNGTVPLFTDDNEQNRFQALQCWLEYTLANPAKLEVTFEDAQGPVLVLDQFKNIINEYSKAVLSGTHENLETYNLQWIQALEAQQQNQAILNGNTGLTGLDVISLQDVLTHVQPDVSAKTLFLEPVAGMIQTPYLSITATKDVDDITWKIGTQGANCLQVQGKNLCNEQHELVLNPYLDETIVPVTLTKTTTGPMTITHQLCKGDYCVSKTNTVSVIPGNVAAITIDFPYTKLLRGSEMPLVIRATDRFGNQIGEQLDRFQITADQGTINRKAAPQEFTHFTNTIPLFSAADMDEPGTVTINVQPLTNTSLPSASATFEVVDGALRVLQDNQPITAMVYDLPDEFDAIRFTDANGIQNINTQAIPTLTLELQDQTGEPLDVVASLRVKNGIIKPGYITTKTKTLTRDEQTRTVSYDSFVASNVVAIENGQAQLQLMPTMTAGEDELLIEIPGREPLVIPITINPGSAKVVYANTTISELAVNATSDVALTVTDIWNNTIPGTTSLDVRVLGSLAYDAPRTIEAIDGQATINIRGTEPGGRGYVSVLINRINISQQLPGVVTYTIQNSFVPKEDLNVMYMNIFGGDWANQWGYFSTNNKVANAMINDSPKLLAVTTQLTNPEKLYQFVATLDPLGQLTPEQAQDHALMIRGTGLYLQSLTQGYAAPLGSLTDFTLEQRQTLQGVDVNGVSTPTIFYIPQIPDASFTQNIVQGDSIMINGASVFDIADASSELVVIGTDKTVDGANVYEVRRQAIKVGEMLVYRNDNGIIDSIADAIIGQEFGVTVFFGEGSSNGKQSLGIYQLTAPGQAQGYDSIEASVDYTKNIGFRHEFENISAFSAGNTVGEATKGFASPYLINIGDPLLKRIDRNQPKNGTDFDPGIGQVIDTDAQGTILKVIEGDLNDDQLTDLITIYQDGRVKWLKNYGGDNPMHDMGDLLHIAHNITDAWLGDVDGNNYNDIIVRMQDDTLRVYKNNNVVFDVDGYPLCLDHGGVPDSMANVNQLFFEDMDLDGAKDVVLNTNAGEIKIIYGGTSASGDAYVSTNIFACDSQWQQRQQDNQLLVRQYGSSIDNSLKIVDNSLLRWQGLSDENEFDDIINQDISGNLPQLIPGTTNLDLSTLDPLGIVDDSADAILRRTASPVATLPVYETLPLDDIRYIAANQIRSDDDIQVHKTYQDRNGGLLQSGDVVGVTVTIQGTRTERMTYIDQLLGPWTVDVDDTDRVVSFASGSLNSDFIYTPLPDSDYLFMLDNIALENTNQIQFTYDIVYNGGPLVRIAIDQVNQDQDDYPDIRVYPLDGCLQYRRDLINTVNPAVQFREYDETQEDLGATLGDYIDQQNQASQNHIGDMTNAVADVTTSQSTDALQELTSLGDAWDFGSIFDNFGTNLLQGNGELNLGNIDLNFFEEELTVVNEFIDEALQGLCQGFSLEKQGCTGLPVPFNMAFLAPGEFNIFGCKPKFPVINRFFPDDKGFPAFWFPGTLQTNVGPVPFPWGPQMLSQVDDFGYGFPSEGGTYPSMVRVYLAPTLTMKLGLAVCLGPQAGFNNIPSPFQDLGGNCVVVSLPTPLACDDTGAEEGVDEALYESLQGNSCNTPPINPQQPGDVASSPLSFQVADVDGNMRPPFPDGVYGGFIQFESSPTLRNVNSQPDNGVALKPGEQLNTQIQGGIQAVKGLVKCMVTDWMDRQLRYLINNMTNMTVGLYLPDLSQLVEGFDQLTIDEFNQRIENLQASQNKVQSNEEYEPGDVLGNAGVFAMRQTWLQKGKLRELSDGASNPFDAISTMFNAVPLVNINTRDVNVTIPMIYSEDIRAYTTYLKSWLEENRGRVQEREGIIQSTLGVCGQELTPDQIKNGISKAAQNTQNTAQDIRTQISQMQTTVRDKRTNMNNELRTLESCLVDIQNGGDASACGGQSAAVLNQQINNLSAYAQVNNQCMSFLFGNKVNGSFQTDIVNTDLTTFITFQENSQQVIRQVRQNLRILEQYRLFPFELYEWVHVWDRYLSELSAVLDSFLGSVMQWIQQNARRFEKWVDAVITMIGVIKTWQAIIDLSVNRSSTCSKCTNENYDNYSCKLSFICVDLPIIPIPQFKIPSIFLDFSHIDLGIDVLLPEFNFVPTRVPLPQLPNLPSPPQVNIDIDLDLKLGGEFENEVELFGNLLLNLNRGLDVGSLSIPSIPLLPEPPVLPPLPSVLPTLEIELPLLPPAPQIPNLSPEVQTVIDILDVVGKMYCIFKSGVGLVSEPGVKTRIEQMTQREWNVPLFDFVDLTSVNRETPLRGFDRKLDAFVEFNYNFTYVYDLIKGFADISNQAVNQVIVQPTNESIETFNQTLNQGAQKYVPDFSTQNIDLNITIPGVDETSTQTSGQTSSYETKQTTIARDWNTISDHIVSSLPGPKRYEQMLDVADAYSVMRQGLVTLINSEMFRRGNPASKKLLTDTFALVEADARVIPNEQGVQAIKDDVKALLTQKKQAIIALVDTIDTDYDQFLDSIGTTRLVNETQEHITYETNLFDTNPVVKKALAEQEHPMRSYLRLHDQMLDGFDAALQRHTPAQLNMDIAMHDKIQGQVRYVQSSVDVLIDVLDEEVSDTQELQERLQRAKRLEYVTTKKSEPQKLLRYALQTKASCPIADTMNVSDTTHGASDSFDSLINPVVDRPVDDLAALYVPRYHYETQVPLYAQAGTPNTTSTTPTSAQSSVMQYLNFKEYLQGIYIKGQNRYINVVHSAWHASRIEENYIHTDITQDGKDDIVMRTDDTIYIKYAEQNDRVGSAANEPYFTTLYEFSSIQSADNLAQRTQNTQGYLSAASSSFKLYSPHYEVKNFGVSKQGFDGVTYSWKNSSFQNEESSVDGYLLQVVLRSDSNHTKGQTTLYLDEEQDRTQYVLMLPEGKTEQNAKILVPDHLPLANVSQYMTGTIMKVGNYLSSNEVISYALTQVPRKRYYSRIISLENIGTEDDPVYIKQSPRSQQILGGQQIIADEEPPLPTITLVRNATNQLVDEGNDLDGYINTSYDMIIQWEDNVQVAANAVYQSGVLLANNTGDTTVLTGLFFDDLTVQNYQITAVDVNNNDAQDETTLTIAIPNLAITQIDDVIGGKNVITNLDQDLDEGNIRFERNRFGARERIQGMTGGILNELYPITVGQFITTGGVFEENPAIQFNDSNNQTIATLDPQNGHLQIAPSYQSQMVIKVDTQQHLPIVQLFDTTLNSVLFAIYLKPQQLIGSNPIQLFNGNYSLQKLKEAHFGDFSGGYCVQNATNTCELYVSPQGQIYIPEPYHTSIKTDYQFNVAQETLTYTFTSSQGVPFAAITFQVEPIQP